MQIRRPKWNHNGTIDCEVKHPKHGWIPFTASSDDVEEYGREVYKTIIESGKVVGKPPRE